MALRNVKNPILLDGNLNDVEMLRPTKGSLSLKLCGVSEENLTLPVNSVNVPMHAWIKVFNQNGFVGIYRRTSNNRNIPSDQSATFRHGIDILQDSIWAGETDFEGTKTQFLTALLNQQTHLVKGVKPWVLGTCQDSSTYKKSIKNDNLMDLFQDLEDEGGDYYFQYDQTVWPWQVSYLQRSSNVASEFRLQRNMEKCRISENDSELCTRLVLEVNAMVTDSEGVQQNESVTRTYNNAAAQAIYGIIVKTEDIDTTDTLPNGPFPEADAFASKFLSDRAAPIVTVQIDGLELYRRTGDTWDEARLGTLCRVAIPDYDTYISQRVVAVSYPDQYGVSDRVTITLSNATPKTLKETSSLSSSVSTAQRTASKAGSRGRSNSRAVESFDQHFKIVDDNNNVLKQAGMHLDANGLLVYADDNVNMVGSRFNVQADKIGMVVGTRPDGRNFVKAGEICIAINESGETSAVLDADRVLAGRGAETIGDLELPDWMDTTEGLIATKATIVDLNALRARVGTLEADTVKTANLASAIAAIDLLTVNALSVQGGTNLSGTLTVGGKARFSTIGFGSGVGATDFSDCVINASVSNNVLTLTKASGGTVTFSKATSLSGGWSGGRYTVTASPQGNTNSTKLQQLVGNGSVSVSSSGKIVSQNFYVMYGEDGDTSFAQTGANLQASINASSVYNSGWDYGQTQRVRTAADAGSQDITIKLLDFDQRWTITDTYTKSNGTTSTVKYTVAAPSASDARQGWTEGIFTSAGSKCKSGLTVFYDASGSDYVEMAYRKDGSWISAGRHYWFYGSTSGTTTLYRKS